MRPSSSKLRLFSLLVLALLISLVGYFSLNSFLAHRLTAHLHETTLQWGEALDAELLTHSQTGSKRSLKSHYRWRLPASPFQDQLFLDETDLEIEITHQTEAGPCRFFHTGRFAFSCATGWITTQLIFPESAQLPPLTLDTTLDFKGLARTSFHYDPVELNVDSDFLAWEGAKGTLTYQRQRNELTVQLEMGAARAISDEAEAFFSGGELTVRTPLTQFEGERQVRWVFERAELISYIEGEIYALEGVDFNYQSFDQSPLSSLHFSLKADQLVSGAEVLNAIALDFSLDRIAASELLDQSPEALMEAPLEALMTLLSHRPEVKLKSAFMAPEGEVNSFVQLTIVPDPALPSALAEAQLTGEVSLPLIQSLLSSLELSAQTSAPYAFWHTLLAQDVLADDPLEMMIQYGLLVPKGDRLYSEISLDQGRAQVNQQLFDLVSLLAPFLE